MTCSPPITAHLAPGTRQEEALVVEVHGGVCGHAALHQLRELADVHPALAQPREDPGVAPIVELSTKYRENIDNYCPSLSTRKMP